MNPIAESERIELLDALRGFALFGVLLVNTRMIGHTSDDAAAFFMRTIADAKFYGLFSALFGFGLVIFYDRATARGVAFLPLYTRRLVALAGIGALHVALGWWGDILIMYAVVGSVALYFRHAPPRVLFGTAVGSLLAAVLIQVYGVWGWEPAAVPDTTAVYAAGSFAQITQQRITDYILNQRLSMAITVLGFMLAGMGAARAGWLHRSDLWEKVILLLPFGVFAGLVYAVTADVLIWEFMIVGIIAKAISAPLLAAVYVGIVYHADWLNRWLSPVGRMALSNYLTQTLVLTLIFYGYGLGLIGRLSTTAGVGLAVLIFAVQMVVSSYWLARFPHGPIEFVWRFVTYPRVKVKQHAA